MLKRFNRVFIVFIILCIFISTVGVNTVSAMPFYDLQPKDIVLRSRFYTTYINSGEERKHNIELAVKSIDNTFVDVNGEFSFNKRVGVRSEKNGYKEAKIIKNGNFVDGIGGGVCQVSTTLYNAVLLAGLKITEVHQHSLAVNYISPSFDAMVNSWSADLRFVNNTHNPIIIRAKADGERITVKIYGEKQDIRYERESKIIQEIEAPKDEIVLDTKGEYPELKEGERKRISYSKNGLISEGYLIGYRGKKEISRKRIRRNKYGAVKGIIIEGVRQ